MIDVSYRYKQADLKGGKMMMDPETGVITLVDADEEPEQQPVPVDEHIEMPLPKNFEKPTAPLKKVKPHGKA